MCVPGRDVIGAMGQSQTPSPNLPFWNRLPVNLSVTVAATAGRVGEIPGTALLANFSTLVRCSEDQGLLPLYFLLLYFELIANSKQIMCNFSNHPKD